MNEKKQVFNMYKTQKAKEEKVTPTVSMKVCFKFVCRRSKDNWLRKIEKSYAKFWKSMKRFTLRFAGEELVIYSRTIHFGR